MAGSIAGEDEAGPGVRDPLRGGRPARGIPDARTRMRTMPPPFAVGFGIGTLCAEADVATAAMDAAISNANPVRMPALANRSALRDLGFLFNASSCLAFGSFIVVSVKGDIVFP